MVRTDGRAYGHVITKFSRMGRLPHFLSYGAPSTRGLRARVELRYQVAHKPFIKDKIEMLHLLYQLRIHFFLLAMWFLLLVVFGPILAQVSALTDPLPSALSK